MRPAPADRMEAERVLEQDGWTMVGILKGGRDLDPNTYQKMLTWCEQTIGAGRVEPGSNWLDGNDVWYSFTWYSYWSFHFKHAKDATAFSLRWM